MKELFSRFSAIFLIGLLLIKISAFHVYEHQDSIDDSNTNCERCILTLDGQQLDGQIPSSVSTECELPLALSQPKIISFGDDFGSLFYEGTLFSRPPPCV